ncbi:hypothetical protein PVK06_034826 [Gossypium arboreum]|uniref:Uncharacterized protein n=1 Tax=Gossypium arboreum TaxID=29729 RepID=A0ABR0NF79_GOSAR|nr:hypothetical protein PVK06_034826 [Gossypium arboreum]
MKIAKLVGYKRSLFMQIFWRWIHCWPWWAPFMVVDHCLEAVGEVLDLASNVRSVDGSGTLPKDATIATIRSTIARRKEFERLLRPSASANITRSIGLNQFDGTAQLRLRQFSAYTRPIGLGSLNRLPRIPDVHASDISDSTGSHINSTQYGSNCDGTDSYISMPIDTTSWYLDFGATHHVCRNASALRNSTYYSGKSSLLMGEGTLTAISSIGNSILPTHSKCLCLSLPLTMVCFLNFTPRIVLLRTVRLENLAEGLYS